MVGPYNHYMKMSPFADFRVADIGDVHLRTTCNLEEALQDIEAFYRKIASAGVVPITAGGDHSITYPILRGIARQERVGLVHFDSHCDTAHSYGGSGLHHGCPYRNAVESGLVNPERTIQVGIRGGTEPLWQYSCESGMRVVHIEEFYEVGCREVARERRSMMGTGPVYTPFDIDCIDPAFAPGTGTPVVVGMTTFEALQTLRGLRGLDIIGADIVEVSPLFDNSGITSLAGATLMFELLCLAAESPARSPA